MAFPTPTLYSYRVVGVSAVNAESDVKSYFVAEFSTDDEATWRPVLQNLYWSETEAINAIAKIVANEAQFQTQFLQVSKFANKQVVPVRTVYAYPPV